MSDDVVKACPACDATEWYAYRPSIQGRTHDAAYVCEACGETFNDPVIRPPAPSRNGSERSSQLVADLLDADPEEVGP